MAIAAVAAIERAVELTLDYTKERKAFGKPIVRLPEHPRSSSPSAQTKATSAACSSTTASQRTSPATLDAETARWRSCG